MPSASAKLEKQASTEAEPIKQGITIIEHKIRNLEKRKSRLESYKDQQNNGKELNSDQLAAIAKYDEVQQTLEFARELCKQFNVIAAETAKVQKKQARKDTIEKTQQELARVKEILLIQDVLANMGQETIREDFLAGRNGAVKLTEEDLQHLDDLFGEVSPKREADEETRRPFAEQVQKAAEHFILICEGKNKDIVGTTYTQLRKTIQDIHTCGYFDTASEVAATETEVDAVPAQAAEEEDFEGDEEEPVTVPTATFQSSKTIVLQQVVAVNESKDAGSAATHIIPPQVTPPQQQHQQPTTEVISVMSSVDNSSFHFLQDSELDGPEVVPTAPPASALPIPSQTFTNQNFVPPPQSYRPPQPHPQPQQVYHHATNIPIAATAGQQQAYAAAAHTYTASAAAAQPQHQPPAAATYQQQQATVPPLQQAPLQQQVQHQTSSQQQPQKSQTQQQQPQVERVSDWSESSNVVDSTDWNIQCEVSETWQEPKHHNQSSENWVDSHGSNSHHGNNDGFVPAGGMRSGGRGRGRGGSRGGPRGGRNNSSGGYYNRNAGGGENSGGSNYYNGYQNRDNSSNYNKRGSGPRGGGGPRTERGGQRGGGQRGGGGRGGNRQ